MKTTSILIVLTLIFSTSFAQTKWIAHKSHSGAVASFAFDPIIADYGPGVGYFEEIVQDTSDIVLKTVCDRYPVVVFDEDKPAMRFLDENDSLIGCDRSYSQYLWAGTIVYSEKDEKFFVYDPQLNPTDKRAPYFQDVTDSVVKWTDMGLIADYPTHIFSGGPQNGQSLESRLHRGNRRIIRHEIIPVNYPSIPYNKLTAFKQSLAEQKNAIENQSAPQAEKEELPKKERTLPILPCMAMAKIEVQDTIVEEYFVPTQEVVNDTPIDKKGYTLLYIIGVVLLGGLLLLIAPRKDRKSPKDY